MHVASVQAFSVLIVASAFFLALSALISGSVASFRVSLLERPGLERWYVLVAGAGFWAVGVGVVQFSIGVFGFWCRGGVLWCWRAGFLASAPRILV